MMVVVPPARERGSGSVDVDPCAVLEGGSRGATFADPRPGIIEETESECAGMAELPEAIIPPEEAAAAAADVAAAAEALALACCAAIMFSSLVVSWIVDCTVPYNMPTTKMNNPIASIAKRMSMTWSSLLEAPMSG